APAAASGREGEAEVVDRVARGGGSTPRRTPRGARPRSGGRCVCVSGGTAAAAYRVDRAGLSAPAGGGRSEPRRRTPYGVGGGARGGEVGPEAGPGTAPAGSTRARSRGRTGGQGGGG